MRRRSLGTPSYEELTPHLVEVSAALQAIGSEAVDAVLSAVGASGRLIVLQEDDGFFRTLVTEMQEGAASVDAAGTILYANPRLAEMLGLPLSKLLGRTLPELTSEGGRPAAQRLLVQAANGPARGALELLHSDGRALPASLSAAPIGGESPEICLVIADLTEQKATETRLRLAEDHFRSTFEQAPIGMALLGLDGCLERVNAAFSAITGRPEEALVGAAMVSVLDRENGAALPSRIRRLCAGEHDWRGREIRYRDAEGRQVWVSESAALVRDADGQPRHILLQVEDIGARREYGEKLEFAANHDSLTLLLNRRAFERVLAHHVELVGRYGAEGALVMLDLDGFKYINDTLGHKAGDDLLLSVSVALGARLRETDSLARLGGDEFGVLLPRADRHEAEVAATALLHAIREVGAPGLRRVSASAGVALFGDLDTTADEMLVRVDLAMYEAKERGRDRIVFYEPSTRDPGTKLVIGWLERVERAIAGGSLLLHAQPIVGLATGRVECYELLVRIADDDGGFVAAAEFVPVAERCGLIAEIDRWVVDSAIGLLLAGATPSDVRLAVNVSAKSLNEEYVAWIEGRLAAHQVDPSRLTFELTESAAISSFSTASGLGRRLQGLGCELALDDFGAGFGSFTYLRRLPFDVLKIDGQFVHNCAHDQRDRVMVEAMVRMAGSLGKRTVAEFVGDEATADTLRKIGVDMGQGYHFGRPAPIEEVLDRHPPPQPV